MLFLFRTHQPAAVRTVPGRIIKVRAGRIEFHIDHRLAGFHVPDGQTMLPQHREHPLVVPTDAEIPEFIGIEHRDRLTRTNVRDHTDILRALRLFTRLQRRALPRPTQKPAAVRTEPARYEVGERLQPRNLDGRSVVPEDHFLGILSPSRQGATVWADGEDGQAQPVTEFPLGRPRHRPDVGSRAVHGNHPLPVRAECGKVAADIVRAIAGAGVQLVPGQIGPEGSNLLTVRGESDRGVMLPIVNS